MYRLCHLHEGYFKFHNENDGDYIKTECSLQHLFGPRRNKLTLVKYN